MLPQLELESHSASRHPSASDRRDKGIFRLGRLMVVHSVFANERMHVLSVWLLIEEEAVWRRDQNLFTCCSIRCPVAQQVQHFSRVALSIRQVWPVGSPDQAIRPRLHQSATDRRDVPQPLLLGDAVGSRQPGPADPCRSTARRRSKSSRVRPSDSNM